MKYLRQMICMIFLMIVITILPNYKVNALTINGIDFPEFPGDNNDSYVLYYSSSSYNDGIPFGYNLVTFNKDNIKYVNFQVRSSVTRLGFYKDFCFDDCSLYDVKIDEEDYKVYNLNNSSWELKTKTSDKNQFKPSANTILSSNITIYVSYDTYDNSTLYKSDENVVSTRIKNINGNYTQFTINPPTSLEDIKNHVVYSPMVTEPIEFNFITGSTVDNLDDLRDFDNNLYRKLQIDFKNYKSNYNYMVSFDDTNWFSVLSQFNADSDENIIPRAYFNIPISTNVYAKIVDSQGNELTKNSILVELEKGFEKIGHITNNDINNLSIVEIDIENITSGFSPMRFALTYSTSSKDIEKIPNFLKYSIIGLDKNGNEFSFNIDDYYFIKQYDYSPDTYEKTQYLNIINKEYSVPDGLVRLRVKFYFDNTIDYTLDVVTTNTVSKTHVDFISSEFENYIKYVFPKDYTKAIIKPKNNNTTESNLIVLSDYFVNDNLELLNYDFINNSYDVQYNFNFTEYNDLYKYSDNEKFLNLKLIFDKENKIYPVLHNNYKLVPKMSGLGSIDGSYEYKDYEQDYVEFYLPKNLYVEFVNVEELEKKVENITDEDFEKDDDIDISSGFTEKMKERYFEEETQNNNFSQFFKQIYDNFSKKFIFVGQFVEIIDAFKKEIRWNGEIPSFKVNIDIPQIGLSVGEMDLIDMKYFAQYRETVHNFIKLFISIFTAVGVYRGVKGAFS